MPYGYLGSKVQCGTWKNPLSPAGYEWQVAFSFATLRLKHLSFTLKIVGVILPGDDSVSPAVHMSTWLLVLKKERWWDVILHHHCPMCQQVKENMTTNITSCRWHDVGIPLPFLCGSLVCAVWWNLCSFTILCVGI